MTTVPFIEQDCTITHEGREFTAGGAYLCDCTDGYRRGIVYAKPDHGIVTDWHGNKIADASFGHPYRGRFGTRMRSVTFTVDGVTYAGRYGFDWADAVRVKSTKKVTTVEDK